MRFGKKMTGSEYLGSDRIPSPARSWNIEVHKITKNGRDRDIFFYGVVTMSHASSLDGPEVREICFSAPVAGSML